jgi:asparagine synthase (glutamine-hydrolysing)
MCGICGIVDWKSVDHRSVVNAMCDTMIPRGPDDRGIHQLNGCCLGQQRLSIIDLTSAGHQPMCNEDGTLWLVVNGEIYGYRELKDELVKKGHVFKSSSDSEIILHGFESWGIDGLCKRLSGMFAFALWNQKSEILYLARDRFGEKPLYYIRNGTDIRFASNTQALFVHSRQSPVLDPDGIMTYLHLNYCLPQYPILKNITTVFPATYIEITATSEVSHSYWEITNYEHRALSIENWLDELEHTLKSVVKNQLISDVPVGCLLSGGVDSSLIASIAKENASGLQLFTVCMPGSSLDESKKAAKVANKIDAKHHILNADPIQLYDFVAFQRQFSQPLGDASSIAEWMIAKYARQHVKVILTGDGGDELFAGYGRIALNMNIENIRNPFSHTIPRKGLDEFERITRGFLSAKSSKIATFSRAVRNDAGQMLIQYTALPKDIEAVLLGPQLVTASREMKYHYFLNELWESTQGAQSLLDRLLKLDINMNLIGHYLPKIDTATMACSLESRAPFLDHHLAELAFSIPSEIKYYKNQPKYLLKSLLKKRLGTSANESIRRKQGFVLPIDRWLNEEWSPLVHDLPQSPLISDGFLNAGGITYLMDKMKKNPASVSRLRYSLVVLDLWYRSLIEWH